MDLRARERWLAHANSRLRGAGARHGAGRTAVVELLAAEAHCLLSAQEISDRLRERGDVGSPATVYRALETLRELGLVHRFDGGQGVARYEIADPSGEHHHHFVDDETGDVSGFRDAGLERAIARLSERLGLELSGHDVVLRGRRRRADDAATTQ